jgi:N-acetyl-anhydromuramyl-L-alanine amidase AmpD
MFSELKISSPNFLIREYDPTGVYISATPEGMMVLGRRFSSNDTKTSFHYAITTDGKTVNFVDSESRAMNEFDDGYTITILLCDVVNNSYGEKQTEALVELVATLCGENRIPLNKVHGTLPGFPMFEFLNGVGSVILEKSFQ